MSDTPRTKAASRMAFSGEYMVEMEEAQKIERELAQSKEANARLMHACYYLERELDEAREDAANQRRLADMALAHRDVIIAERDTLAVKYLNRGGEIWEKREDGRERELFASDVINRLLATESQLAEVTKQRDHYKAACDQYSEDEMLCKLQEVTKQRDEWKANHDNQVAINRTLRDRPDLGERAKTVDALTKQRDALAEALREMLKFTPHSLVCQDFHHPTKDCHSESEDCQPTKRFRDALAKAEQALAATKGGSDE
jgi:hypothetical protein